VNLVLDSSALITLARIGRLGLLRQLARAVHIPEAVYGEVVMRDVCSKTTSGRSLPGGSSP